MYKREVLFDKKEIDTLLEVYRKGTPTLFFQDYNLFNIERIHLTSRQCNECSFLHRLNEYTKLSTHSHSLIKYGPGSFGRVHRDGDIRTTIVTILEVENLIGGEMVCYTTYNRRPRPRTSQVKRVVSESNTPPYNKDIIPEVVPSCVGESIVYTANMLHGVAKVQQGYRLALVSWFR